ncbi:MAG: NUDIX domain-containing protein [Pseudonocardiaceae bacterium]
MGRVGKKSVIETWTLPATHCTIAKIQRVQRGLQDLTRRPLLASPHFSFIRLRDQTGRIFLANPTYKEYWDLPGRMAEANEPPRVAAEREVAEELGFQAKISHLISVDWIGPHGPWDDYLIFMFDGGTLVDAAIKRLIITDSEISEFGFFSVRDTSRLLRKDAARRLGGSRTRSTHWRTPAMYTTWSTRSCTFRRLTIEWLQERLIEQQTGARVHRGY